MDIRISGHQIDTGEALRVHVAERLNGIAERFFSRAISAHVTFGKGPYDHSFICDIVAHVPQGMVLKGHGGAVEAHPAFDVAADRIEKQLRRYKRRLKDRHMQTAHAEAEPRMAKPPTPMPWGRSQSAKYSVRRSSRSGHTASARITVPGTSISGVAPWA